MNLWGETGVNTRQILITSKRACSKRQGYWVVRGRTVEDGVAAVKTERIL